jgi:hypothetical protein
MPHPAGGILGPMLTATGTRKHGKTVGFCFFTGYFLLIFSAGTFGSAAVLSHNQAKAKSEWTEATAQLRNCTVGAHDRTGIVYALHCNMSYQIAGRPYENVLSSSYTRSTRVRAAIANWISKPGHDSIIVRVNPVFPHDFYVQSPLPIHQRHDPDDFIYAGIVIAILGLTLTAIGRKLVRAGW